MIIHKLHICPSWRLQKQCRGNGGEGYHFPPRQLPTIMGRKGEVEENLGVRKNGVLLAAQVTDTALQGRREGAQ